MIKWDWECKISDWECNSFLSYQEILNQMLSFMELLEEGVTKEGKMHLATPAKIWDMKRAETWWELKIANPHMTVWREKHSIFMGRS